MPLNSNTLGQRIRKAREDRGISQRELAQALGIGQRGISELENGNRKLALSELPILAVTLDVPILYFIEGSLIQQEEYEQLLLMHFRAIPSDELKKTVVEIARILAESQS